MLKTLAAAFFLLGAASAASAQASQSIRVNGVEIQVPIPDGYCLPTGTDVDAFQLLAAADRENVTHLSLAPCGGSAVPALDYILIKTPREALLADIDRAGLLQGMGLVFDSPEFAAVMAATPGQVADNLSSTLGRQVDLGGELRPRGRDDVCAYLAGTMRVASGPQSYAISMSGCITAVGRRVVTINWYGPDRGPEGVAALIVRSRQLAASMSARPAR